MNSTSPKHQAREVFQLICEFATETYRVNQIVDVLDKQNIWCAAEVTDIVEHQVRIHYTGWPPHCDQWIEVPSFMVAPAFTFTRLKEVGDLPVRQGLEMSVQHAIRRVLSCEVLGLNSLEETGDLFARFGSRIQDVINYARWANRENLEGLL
eukprot:TRINITY_DN7470_c0_g1_i2.p1 TRINITY_DN7470_c0_g1~~TRINITY_DN7470_c0_g1_i2.p1  ORF type:complete len:152 (+),score=17.92 TRINITY_DN7470_c0_g1_i2:88-543(+)